MLRELLAQTTLLALPIAAMFLFVAVFLAISVRALSRSRDEIRACASLPLHDEDPENDHERR